MIDFEIPEDLAQFRDEIRTFVTEQVIPFESDPRLTRHGPTDGLRADLVDLARRQGLLTFQAPRALGGRAPTHVEQAVLYEAAGWSTLGPVALNCAAPDEGNMYLLSRIANQQQVEEYLTPVVDGHQRSVFAMTEPDGAGSDPGQLTTTADFDGSDYVINGHKWLITGAVGAKTWIIMARVRPNSHGPDGPTLFLCDGQGDGLEIERVMSTIFMIADNEIALQQCRLAIWWACWRLDQGERGRHESSMVKALVSEELFRVADRCVQILGGIGISDETPVAMIFSDIRAFRLYDGPTEVHKYAIARQVLGEPPAKGNP